MTNSIPLSILIVDDDITFAQMLKRALDRRGFISETAMDIASAENLMQKNNFTNAILDLKIAQESGLVLISRLREINQDVKIIMLTGYSSISTAVDAIKLGAINYFCKPIEVDDLLKALQVRHDYFHANGCRLSDHGLETVPGADFTREEIESIFNRVRSGKSLTAHEVEQFQNCMLIELAIMDHAKGWAQQFHIGAIRNNNPRLFRQIGPNTGFDSIGDHNYAKPLAKFLGRLDDNNQLTKTILYNLNPRDNEMIGTMIGNFQDGSTPGKIQFGSGWWFLDQMDGMTKQIDALSQLGLLSRFIGMLTDSRSFLSYSRHDYFRRILCGMLGRDMVNGILPNDSKMLGKLVQDISFNNAKNYFSFVLPE